LSSVKQSLQFKVIDPVVAIQSNADHYTLPEASSELEKQQKGESVIDISKLIKITVTINNNQPIYSLISASSLGGKFIIGHKINKQLGVGISKSYVETF